MKKATTPAGPEGAATRFDRIFSHDDSHSDTHGDYHQDQHGDQHHDHDDSPHDDFGESMLDRLERLISRWDEVFASMRREMLQAVDERTSAQTARIEDLEQRLSNLERR